MIKKKKPKLRYYNEYLDNNNKKIKSSKPSMQKYLKGKYDKVFMRCNSGFLRELFDEIINNPNCCYVTYLNDFIRENYSGKSLPIKTVSVLKKEVPKERVAEGHIEEFVSRLGNLYGIPVPFNKFVQTEDDQYILSVDFIGENESFENFNRYFTDYNLIKRYNVSQSDYSTFENPLGSNHSLQEWYQNFMIYPCVLETMEPLTRQQKEELFVDFIPRYMFRKWVVSDYDLFSRNEGVLYNNQTGKFKTFSYDFEYSFSPNQGIIDLAHDITFLMLKYPKELDKFMCMVEKNFEKQEELIENIKEENVKSVVKGSIMNNLLFLMFIYNKAKDIVSNQNFDGNYGALYRKLTEFDNYYREYDS